MGRLVGMGCGFVIVVIGALILLAKPLALGILDAVVLEPMREDITLSTQPADDVEVGQVVTLTILMHNNESHRADGLLYVDLGKGLYDGFEPVLSEPAWVYAYDDEVARRHKLAFEFDLAPGATPYLLQLRARSAGRWEGELSYYRTTSRRPAGHAIPITINVRAKR